MGPAGGMYVSLVVAAVVDVVAVVVVISSFLRSATTHIFKFQKGFFGRTFGRCASFKRPADRKKSCFIL